MSKQGFICLHRQIQSHWLWEEKPFDKRSAWIDLLLTVNHVDNKFPFDGTLYDIKRGQTITSIRKLSGRWGWSRTKVSRFLELAQEEGMITYKSDTKKTVITVVNYDVYQFSKDTEMTAVSQQRTSKKPAKSTNNNVNNEYNEENKKLLMPVSNETASSLYSSLAYKVNGDVSLISDEYIKFDEALPKYPHRIKNDDGVIESIVKYYFSYYEVFTQKKHCLYKQENWNKIIEKIDALLCERCLDDIWASLHGYFKDTLHLKGDGHILHFLSPEILEMRFKRYCD